jgi:hypothetical protein
MPPTPQTPDQNLPPNLRRPPICTACFREMHFTAIGLHPRFRHLDVRYFACDCGERTSDVVVRLG